MTYTRLLAQATVTDGATAEDWYARLCDRAPDARPMPGLLEWHLTDTFGIQVWQEPERAGRSSLVLGVDDVDAEAERVSAAGIAHDGVQPGGGTRLVMLTDPDGNRVVLLQT